MITKILALIVLGITLGLLAGIISVLKGRDL